MHNHRQRYINDPEDGCCSTMMVWLEKLAPHAPTSQYQHTAPARITPTPT